MLAMPGGAAYADGMRGFPLLGLGIFVLSGCSAADGKWPSLMTDQERAAGKAATAPATAQRPETPAGSTAESLPVIPMHSAAEAPAAQAQETQSPAADSPVAASLSPAVSRLEQESRAFDFTLERLAVNRQDLAAAQLAATGKASGSPERLALQAITRQQRQLKETLADIRHSLQMVAGQLARVGQSAEAADIGVPLARTGKLLMRVSAAMAEKTAAPTTASLADGLQAVLAAYSRADAAWITQSAKLKASTAALKRGDPERISWNQAQVDLTRVSQNAKSLESIQENLARLAGDLAVLSSRGDDIAGPLQQIGAALVRIDQRLAENDALVTTARQTLERA
jgi:hypothetical protein